ncbi:MAG: dihydroxyacetone kinase subunit DhaL, partial [Planctomycetota bacterium]
MDSFDAGEGGLIVRRMVQAVHDNAAYLSEIDGAIGDGDHGINMNKGFAAAGRALSEQPGDLAHSLKVLSRILITEIGGAMGPLYGSLFKAMAGGAEGKELIEASDLLEMLQSGLDQVREVGNARVGDKTMVDTLVPAVEALGAALEEGDDFKTALEHMKGAAEHGKNSTKDLVAKVGRSSRLG